MMFPRSLIRNKVIFFGSLFLLASLSRAEYPRGFFVEDLHQHPSVPAFYNLDTHRIEAFSFRRTYANFIDITWDREQGQVFFSARQTPKDPYRVYLKSWPDGEEKAIYENPLGPFRFILSPDGRQLVLQVMGPLAWPILAVHDWQHEQTTSLGQGFSPDWSSDGKRLLFLQILNNALPTRLAEYRVETGTTTILMKEPVAEAVYTDDPDVLVLKTALESKSCDVFHVWNRRTDTFVPFSMTPQKRRKQCATQREITTFPGHQFFFFKESPSATDVGDQTLVITDSGGGRFQTIEHDDWYPKVTAVESVTLVIGEDPLYVISADGTGQRVEVPGARFIRFKQ